MQHLGAYFSHLFSFHMCKLVSYKGIMLWLSFHRFFEWSNERLLPSRLELALGWEFCCSCLVGPVSS